MKSIYMPLYRINAQGEVDYTIASRFVIMLARFDIGYYMPSSPTPDRKGFLTRDVRMFVNKFKPTTQDV